MLLQDAIRSTDAILRGAQAPGGESVRGMLPQMMLPAVVALVLLVGMLWVARKARAGLRVEPIHGGGQATSAALLIALAQREKELAAGGGKIATRRHVPTPAGGEPAAPVGGYDGPVHCPACATQLGVAGPALRYVTRCPACARWIALRIEGERVIVEARRA